MNLINREDGFMCDRVYAPEPDFKPETLYGVESKKSVKKILMQSDFHFNMKWHILQF